MIRKNCLTPIEDEQRDDFKSKLLRFMLLSVSFASLLSMTVNVGVVKAEQLTGCLKNNGKLIKLALGSDPLKPCKVKETEVSLVLDANGGGPTQRVVISDTIDLNARGT